MAKKNIKWTDEHIHTEALKYDTKKEFELAEKSLYSTMHRRGIVDTCCMHMHGLQKWTEELIRKEALKYTSRKEFKINGKGAVGGAIRRGIYDEVCAHMTDKPTALAPSNLKGIYILYLDTIIVYVGKSLSCMNSRVRKHKINKEFDTVEFYEIGSKADIDVLELYLINKYKPLLNRGENSQDILTLEIADIDKVIIKKSTFQNNKCSKPTQSS